MSGRISSNHFAQLDTLRALAVSVVLIHHYRDTPFFLSGFGCTLFFVLSGYFVTKSLLRMKREVAEGTAQAGSALKAFYCNRWLRLWPLYFLVLGLAFLFNVESARSSFLWNAAFLSNIHTLLTGTWSGRFSPLWSLSVLEQFYLVWPALVFCCRPRRLGMLTLAVLAVGPLFRLGCLLFNASPICWCVVPFASFDELGCGALLALCQREMISRRARVRIYKFSGRVCVPAFILLLVGKFAGINPPGSSIYINTVASFAFLHLIQRTSMGYTGWLKPLFEIPLASQIGKMSYSIFLLHNFTELLVPKMGILHGLMDTNYRGLILFPLTILLAFVAWHLIEEPLLALRRKYITSAMPEHSPDIQPMPGWEPAAMPQ